MADSIVKVQELHKAITAVKWSKGKHLIDPQLRLITVWAVIIYAIAFRVFRWE
jgi:hypothetical protein